MNATTSKPGTTKKKKARRKKTAASVSRLKKPDDMSLEQWQVALRRQFGSEQKFGLKNTGEHPVFSEFRVSNPKSGSIYRVVIRGEKPGDNFCACADFATNTLGTCKHIEFTLARLRKNRASRIALREGFVPPESEVVLSYGARREVRFVLGTDSPPELAVMAAEYFGADRTLRPDAFARFGEFLSKARSLDHDLRCNEDALAFIAEVRDTEYRRRRVDQAFPKGVASSAFEKLLKVNLYDYQRQGALFASRAGRCVIGDEMGLGKTIQAIAAVEIMAKLFGVARVLVVCPTSLKYQWENEIAKFSGKSAVVVGGLRPGRQSAFTTASFFKITNYDTVHKDLDLISAWSPDLVILDEAQRIKNWNTRTARSVKRILSPYAIVLTGTPLENRLEELVSIVEFVDRHRLGPTFRFLADHQILDNQSGRVIGYRGLDTINNTLEPILIRRRKDQVLKQLPARLDKNFFVRMTPEQMRHHEENREIVARVVSKWRKYRFLSEADQRRLMIALQNMRMSCNSTYLLDQTTDFGFKADEAVTLLEELLEESDTKVVIFSQWQRTHELLQRRLQKRDYEHVLFNGSVPDHKRKGLVDRFRQESRCRAFLSTDAGGVGLNLQHASAVVNMDLPWNPAVLEQRIGRVHRLGQGRPVQVVNFIAKGTIEESMLSLLKFKKSLFAGVLDGGENQVFLGGSRLSRFMEAVDKAAGGIPAAPVEETAVEEPVAGVSQEESTAEGPIETAPHTPAQASPWAGLLETGLSLLQEIASASRGGGNGAPIAPASKGVPLVRRDAKSGEPYLHLPLPEGKVLDQFLAAAGELLRMVRR